MSHSEERLKDNLHILELLTFIAHKYPDLRFWQLLAISGVIRYEDNVGDPIIKDGFYEESIKTLLRVEKFVEAKC